MDREEIIEAMEALIRKGKDSWEIDQELKQYDLSAEDRAYIIPHLQEYEIAYLKSNTGKQSATLRMLLGVAIMMIGYLGSFADYNDTSRYIIKIGAILGGGIILYSGYRQRKRIVGSSEASKFRKKRFRRYE